MTANTDFVPLEGGCKCGNVRFRMEVAPIITHCCHCRDCQKLSGTAFRVNAMIETTHLTLLEGQPQTLHEEGGYQVVHCPECRSELWSHLPALGVAIALLGVGMLDRGESLIPEVHYFVRSKHPWIVLPPDVPAFEELGDPGKTGVRERVTAALAPFVPATEQK